MLSRNRHFTLYTSERQFYNNILVIITMTCWQDIVWVMMVRWHLVLFTFFVDDFFVFAVVIGFIIYFTPLVDQPNFNPLSAGYADWYYYSYEYTMYTHIYMEGSCRKFYSMASVSLDLTKRGNKNITQFLPRFYCDCYFYFLSCETPVQTSRLLRVHKNYLFSLWLLFSLLISRWHGQKPFILTWSNKTALLIPLFM